MVPHTTDTDESHPENEKRDAYPVHDRNPSCPGGVLTGGAGGGGEGGGRAGGLGGCGGPGGGEGGEGGGGGAFGSRHATKIPVSSSVCVSGLKKVNFVSVLRKP